MPIYNGPQAQGYDRDLDVWNDDLDAFLVSWENHQRGGHGVWWSSEMGYDETDELTEAYRSIEGLLNQSDAEAFAVTSEACTHNGGTDAEARDGAHGGATDSEGGDPSSS